MRALTVAFLALLLGACASSSKRSLDTIPPADAAQLALDAAAYVADELPPASSTLSIPPTPAESNNLNAAMAQALRDRGFAVFDGSEPDPAGHRLVASADLFDAGYILRLELDGVLVTRLYSREPNADLEPSSVFAKRIPQ